MADNYSLPYRVLVFDDQIGLSSWGNLTVALLKQQEYDAIHVSKWDDAVKQLGSGHFDIVVVDLDLGTPKDGMDFFRLLRKTNMILPVVLATGSIGFLERPISYYADVLSLGPVSFYMKTPDDDFLKAIKEASNRVDPVRRSLSLLSAAGMGRKSFLVGKKVYTVDDLLASNEMTDSLIRSLRESLQALVLEIKCSASKGGSGE